MADKQQFAEFQKIFSDYEGDNNADTAAEFVAKTFQEEIGDEEHIRHHVICALDTPSMSFVFEAVKDDIFMKIMMENNEYDVLIIIISGPW